jgi:hypothetical protein
MISPEDSYVQITAVNNSMELNTTREATSFAAFQQLLKIFLKHKDFQVIPTSLFEIAFQAEVTELLKSTKRR